MTFFVFCFSFVAEDGATFDAIYDHCARLQTVLSHEADLPLEHQDRTLSMGNPVVQKVIVGLLSLQGMLPQEVYGKKGERLRTPPVLGSNKGTRGWGHPVVLFS